jgi:hypothetical protein
MTNPKFDRTLTVRGAANYLGLSPSTLNKLRCTGTGPIYFKLGRAAAMLLKPQALIIRTRT